MDSIKENVFTQLKPNQIESNYYNLFEELAEHMDMFYSKARKAHLPTNGKSLYPQPPQEQNNLPSLADYFAYCRVRRTDAPHDLPICPLLLVRAIYRIRILILLF